MSNEYKIELLIDTFLKQTQTPLTLSEILLIREMFTSFANSFNESKLRIISSEQPKPQTQIRSNPELKQQPQQAPVSPTREELLAQLNAMDELDDDEPVPEIDDLEEEDIDVKKSLEDIEAEMLAARKKKQNNFTSKLNNLAKIRKNEQTADFN